VLWQRRRLISLFNGGAGGLEELIIMWRLGAAALCLALSSSARAGDGAGLFAQNCALCHQTGATGLTGQFPRLAGRVAAISSQPAGRAYLIDVLTYGLSGTIQVDDQEIIGVMPPFAALSNEVVADILSYVQTLGAVPQPAPAPFKEREIAAARAKAPKSPDEVQTERQALQQSRVLP
jgi:mono/diheme cytochrome c family protein